MEKCTVELIDYFRVIWKQKILIIVGTLVCIAAGMAMSLGFSTTYRVEVIMRIGKTLSASAASSSLILIDTIANRIKTIPLEYALREGALGYSLSAEKTSADSLIKIVVEGADLGKAKVILREVAEQIIANDSRLTEESIMSYKRLVEKREAYFDGIKNEIAQEMLVLGKMEKVVNVEVAHRDQISLLFLNATQGNMKKRHADIISLQNENFIYQLRINDLVKNQTKMIGEVEGVAVSKNKNRYILKTGLTGLAISILLAFFIEYMGNIRKKEKRGSMS
ncbi:MAG: hypothetical protein HON76_05980 [Candidatus Scalindua sp.]|jgi:capsular polysaccharide biosynthesis protein|nr:hypothetical protein [Candidatus Scalindua sp.]MBT6562058.1 hypothetical protein [Candidatus Scalindua sp.]